MWLLFVFPFVRKAMTLLKLLKSKLIFLVQEATHCLVPLQTYQSENVLLQVFLKKRVSRGQQGASLDLIMQTF